MSDQSRKIQLEAGLDTRPVKQGFQEIVQAAESTATSVKSSADRAGKAVDGIGDGAATSAKKIETAERSIIASIQRRTAAVEAAGQSESKYYETLARQRGVNTDALRPYLAQLDAAKAKQDAAAASMGKMGVSAAQTAAALRGVPAQFTDIITSLQGGQRPLTVLLQQGGQLKDMFGGAGNAAKALGGYVLGLVNPYTVAAAAIAGFGYAAFKGAEELQAFNKTLILTGGVAGVSGDRLMSMAAGISAVSKGVTQGKAAEALNQLVEAGVRGEQQLGRYAKAAAEFERAGGGAAAEVAKQFAALGKDPLQASLKLNDAMGYLSSSTFETIRSLEAQGKTIDAARVAQNAYADAIEKRTPALVQNLGYIESAWKGIAGAASAAVDAALNIGRPETQEAQLARVRTMLANKLPAQGKYGGVVDGEIAALREQEKRLATNLAYNQKDAVVAGVKAQKEKERIAFLGEADKFLTSEQRQQREISRVRDLQTRQIINQEEAEKRIAAIRESGANRARSTGRAGDPFAADRAAAKEWAEYTQKFGDLTAEAEGKVLGLNKAQALLVEYLKSPAYQNASEPMRQLALQQAYAAVNAEKAADALKVEAQFLKIVADKEREWAQETEKRNQSAQQMIDQIQFETSLLGLNAEQREVAIQMRELERLGIEKGTEAYQNYAEALQKALFNRQQRQQAVKFWEDFNSAAESAFLDIAENGESAFKRIGQSLKREVLKLLYEMTVKQWILNISGNYGGVLGGGGNSLLSLAAQNYMSGGSALGSSASALGSWATGGMSTANTYGSIYANATGTGMDGLLATNGAYGTAGAAGGGGSAAAGGSWMSYAGYIALIYAAVQYAEKLYSQGYNRTALGYGSGTNTRVGDYSSYQSDPGQGSVKNNSLNYLPDSAIANFRRNIYDSMGMSEKWSDILSGTIIQAGLIGRRLTQVGLQANINDGAVDVSGYAKYKGGVFRSNKTVGFEADPRDSANLKAEVEAMQTGTRNMAKAMGLSTDAIDHYTGKLKVNFKGVQSNAEAAERLQKSMDDLQYSMLKAASGGKLGREEFDKFMKGVNESIQQAGISTAGLADIMVQGMTGKLSQAEVGDQLASTIVGGIYNAIAGNYASMIANAFMQQIVTPIFTAIAAGVPISQAISQAAIDGVVETANNAAAALNVILQDPYFIEAMGKIQEAISGVTLAVGSVQAPEINNGLAQAEQQRYQIEGELLGLLGNTNLLRERELAGLEESAAALKRHVYALQDAKSGVDGALAAVRRSVEAEKTRLSDLLTTAQESESALNDVFNTLRDAIKNLRGEVTDSALTDARTARESIAKAITGSITLNNDQLVNAIDSVRAGLDKTVYASQVERARDFLRFAGELGDLQSVTQKGLSAAEQQVSLLEDQLAALDSQLNLAEQQVNALYGVDTSVKAVGLAMADLSAAMGTYTSTVQAAMSQTFSSGGGGGGYSFGGFSFGGEGAASGAGWTAEGYWNNNPDLRDYWTANESWLSAMAQFDKDANLSARDEFLKWHWGNNGQAEHRRFASGGAFTNGIVQRPTSFQMGLMGEAGPEAILPLTNVGGRLGVAAQGDAETRKLLQQVIDRLDAVAGNTEATALHGSRTASVLRKAARGDGSLAIMAAEGTAVEVKVVS